MKMKKVTAMGMAVLMAATMIPAVPAMADDAGKVYYLNFKPEQDEDMAESGKRIHRGNWYRGNCCYSSFRTV